jgi:hypothetical protein
VGSGRYGWLIEIAQRLNVSKGLEAIFAAIGQLENGVLAEQTGGTNLWRQVTWVRWRRNRTEEMMQRIRRENKGMRSIQWSSNSQQW